MKNLVCLSITLLVTACEHPKFTEPFILYDGTEISVQTLETGRTAYTLYCRSCHGDNGDGKGPAAVGLRPPPRDFRAALFKFGSVPAGELPTDDDLRRIIRGGLLGTAMLPWELPDDEMDAVIQYLKTFRKVDEPQTRWQKEAVGKAVIPSIDPFMARSNDERQSIAKKLADASYQASNEQEKAVLEREQAAIDRGEKIYHVVAQCLSCHPAYTTRAKINEFNKELRGNCLNPSGFRGFAENDLQDMYLPSPRISDYRFPSDPKDVLLLYKYMTPKMIEAISSLEDPSDLGARYDTIDFLLAQLSSNLKEVLEYLQGNPPAELVFGATLRKPEQTYLKQRLADLLEVRNAMYLTPPDFTFHPLRAGSTVTDLYRTIASGIGGTPMPAWHGSLSEEDLWSLAHYVAYITSLQNQPAQLKQLRATLKDQPEYNTPPNCIEPASQPTSVPNPTTTPSSTNVPTP